MFLCWGYRAFVWCARLSSSLVSRRQSWRYLIAYPKTFTAHVQTLTNPLVRALSLWDTIPLDDSSWGNYSSDDHFPSDVRTLSLRLIPLVGHFASDQTLITSQPVCGDSIPLTPLTVRTAPLNLSHWAPTNCHLKTLPPSSRALPLWLTLLWGHHPSV